MKSVNHKINIVEILFVKSGKNKKQKKQKQILAFYFCLVDEKGKVI